MSRKQARTEARKTAEKAATYGRMLESLDEARRREAGLRRQASEAAREVERLTMMARQFVLTD